MDHSRHGTDQPEKIPKNEMNKSSRQKSMPYAYATLAALMFTEFNENMPTIHNLS